MKFSATTLATVAVTTTTLLLSSVIAQTQQYATFTCILAAHNCVISGTEETVCGTSTSAVPSDCNDLEKDCETCTIYTSDGTAATNVLNKLNSWCVGQDGQLQSDSVTGLVKCSSLILNK